MKTKEEIEEFLKKNEISPDIISVDDNYISTSECCRLSDLLKLKEFLGFKDLMIQTGTLVWRTIPKSNEDLIDEATNELLKEEVDLGYIHPIEEWLMNNFSSDFDRIQWLKEYINQIADSDIKRSAILIVGRLPKNSFDETKEVLSYALLDTSLRVRDAAVSSIENLELLELLDNHKEPVNYLDQYINRLLNDKTINS